MRAGTRAHAWQARPRTAERLVRRLVPDPAGRSRSAGKSSRHRIKIAVLVGILTRAKDPGGTVMWRGLGRLSDVVLGATEEIRDAGNRKSVPGW